jgi:hypothetical protein
MINLPSISKLAALACSINLLCQREIRTRKGEALKRFAKRVGFQYSVLKVASGTFENINRRLEF